MSKRTFQTSKNILELSINGHDFVMNPAEQGLLIKLQKHGEIFTEFSKRTEEDTPQAYKELTALFANTINDMLGEGATEKIFTMEDRDNPYNYMELFAWLKEEILNFYDAQQSKYNPNRIKRNK